MWTVAAVKVKVGVVHEPRPQPDATPDQR